MANLHVAIVVRTNTGAKRSWVVANGKDDPPGIFYLRRCEGSIPKYSRAGDTFGEAEVAKIRLERQLKAHAMGLVVPEEVPTETKKFHRLQDTVDAYMKQISKPDRNFETRPLKSIKGTRYEVESFVKFCGKSFIENLQDDAGRQALLAYRDHLGSEKYQKDTVKNKLAAVVTFLKHNPVCRIVGLLKKDDWPDRKRTTPDPYSEAEINAMLSFATDEESLIIRAFRGTGMRNAELAHAEREDIDWVNKCIYVRRRKDKYGWRAKNKAAVRSIPLDDQLLADFKLKEMGLLFPNAKTGRPEKHLLRVIERLAALGQVQPTTAKLNRRDEEVK
jgi:integrase